MSKLIYELAKHTCFSSLIYMCDRKSRAEQKEQALNAKNIWVQESWGDKVECIHVGQIT